MLKVIKYKIDILKRSLFKNKIKMSSFPLYDNLKKDIPKKDLTIKQKEELINSVLKMDNNAKEIIYVLIQYYNAEYNTNIRFFKGSVSVDVTLSNPNLVAVKVLTTIRAKAYFWPIEGLVEYCKTIPELSAYV